MTDANRARRSALRTRIVVVGFGVAAMAGLVHNMEVAGVAKTTASAPAPPAPAREGALRVALARHRASVPHPIVLTPHAVVHSVSGPALDGGGSVAVSSGYAAAPAAAAVPAAAPVASTSGSHP